MFGWRAGPAGAAEVQPINKAAKRLAQPAPTEQAESPESTYMKLTTACH